MSRPARTTVLTPSEQSLELSAALRAVLIPGLSRGGPAQLRGSTLTALLAVEREGLHTVLLAGCVRDLSTDVAAVTRLVCTDDAETAEAARAMWGAERVVLLPTLTEQVARRAATRLPVPASRTWRRRLQNRLTAMPRLGRGVAAIYRRVSR